MLTSTSKASPAAGVTCHCAAPTRTHRPRRLPLCVSGGGRGENVTDDDDLTTGRIAWAHLKEIPDYYTRLAVMEADVGS